MELKVSLYLKSGYVISDTGSDLDQESIEQWLNEFTSGEKEWISIGKLPWMSLVPVRAIECISFEDISQSEEKADYKWREL
ncbi:TPA: hypothetical protein ACWL3Y_003103 [Enterococcus faecalis]|uniref:hypothetical protein n=1 Tax=Enterococcus faecalis TaxID=1351 RepID=UPI0015718CE1|nr:hypothetical protein [Enterococcus faecalis]MBJ0389668.1 hypothetical protein [Enterococcus faecalis]MBJ0476719.1 hypothetical protein [Enterococcus faecalis]MBJ1452521.1 hypothetical protein [Enterococcus faecalis]NSS32381.1 hypothetical protein [Enterococcus faecalis]NSS43867.1 hypothetical protein [Enterococcus faecalis]